MSAWGTGIKQSDEFADVYEEFYELYVDGAKAEDIYKTILNEYLNEFSGEGEDCYLYTVYYALALCLWECGVKDNELWRKIKEIIDSGADLAFWGELGCEPRQKISRQKALLKFWDKINSVPDKIKKPKDTSKKRQPTIHKGDVYCYLCDGGYRVALVLDYIWDSYLTAISENIFDTIPTIDEAMNAFSHTVIWMSQRESIPKKDRILITELDIDKNYNNRAGMLFSERIVVGCPMGERKNFYALDTADDIMKRLKIGRYKMSELLDPEVLPKCHPRVNVDLL